MRRILAPVATSLILALLVGCTASRSVTSRADLDGLFVRLRTTANADEARRIELAILHAWTSSGRADVDALMLRGAEMAHTGDLDGALETYNRIVELAPNFAEAYDQRALIHAMRDEYGKAVTDIERVLVIEPRHFGALAGLGRILMLYGQDKAALRAFEAALAINPHLDDVRDEADRLRATLAGQPI